MLVIGMYSVLSLIDFVIVEVLPLWATTPASKGGLSWDSSNVATLMGIAGVANLGLQIVLYPRLIGCVGVLTFFRFCNCATVATCFVIPWLPLIMHHQGVGIWLVLIAVYVVF
eukprot:gnl/MRDRNA2_/MRDRNA2_77217_c0_seq1.p1 gnl/MRDRNA2_/MRDRNA2_77217_c0~~gnl/MRDRNA2_/MRDRNA2_77217_c0_seq1.p1  ORF type:complete len:127 (+),score=7.27 gnl/MRDRNA2_/MRDRNA2_77217_c0_seq1:45-383(+)